MKKYLLFIFIFALSTGIVLAFTNSLDGGQQGVNTYRNNFSNYNSQSNSQSNKSGQSYSPKEHTGFEHQDRNFPNPTMNDSRYNSNCQFGTCSPGGVSPSNR